MSSIQNNNLETGVSCKTIEQFNSNYLPTYYEIDKYQNGVLSQITKENVSFSAGLETIDWSIENKITNNTTTGSYSIKY